MTPRVPPELTDRIIDYLWDSQIDLRTCSLVCSHWLPTSRRHIFESLTVRRDARFLALVQCPSNVVANYTRAVDFRLWSPEIDDDTCRILPSLPNLEALTVGEIPPSPENFPVLPRVRKLSLQHTSFASCVDFVLFISKFPDLRELELGWITWAGGHYDVWSRLEVQLEHLSIRGFEQAPHILQWLSSANHSPQTT
ncbi:hypothetical protein C8R45DRAFT_363595 [Mycena sanguinolenta]|nr:hypothetical protein C8R45DRAFT_363595 [Mycena sanguinolenta]